MGDLSSSSNEPLQPVLAVWPAGRSIVRAHPSEFGATEFDGRATSQNRFSPMRSGRRLVPVLYGAGDVEAAASETIFHTVPAPEGSSREVRPRLVALTPYVSLAWSTIACRRDLTLVSLRGSGLASLGVTREQMILSGRDQWTNVRRWAEGIWHDSPHADGLWWTSRQAARRDVIMLFESRRGRPGGVRRYELEVVEPPVPFLAPPGLERLCEVATRLDITLVVD